MMKILADEPLLGLELGRVVDEVLKDIDLVEQSNAGSSTMVSPISTVFEENEPRWDRDTPLERVCPGNASPSCLPAVANGNSYDRRTNTPRRLQVQ